MNWLGRLNRGLDNDHTLCSAVKLITYADRGKMPPQADSSLLKKKKQQKKPKFSVNSMSRWGSITYRGLLRIVDAATWPGTCSTARRTKVYIIMEQKHPFSHDVLIFTVAKPGGQVETSAGNLSKSPLVLILENEEWKSQDGSSTQFWQWLALVRMIHWTGRTPPPPVCFPFIRLVIPVLQNTSKRFHGMSMAGNPDKGFLCQKTNTKKNMVLM